MNWQKPGAIDEKTKRAKIRQYFAPDRGPQPSLFIGFGAGAVFAAVILGYFHLPSWCLIAACLVAIVFFSIAWVSFNEREQRARDEDLDIWRDEDFARIVKLVSDDAKLNAADLIDPDNPIVFYGLPRFKHLKIHHNHDDGTVRPRWQFKVKVGADRITRYSPPCLTVLHFSKDHLLAYQCDLDLTRGVPLNETIDEYFWQDIASLQIERQTLATEHDDRSLYAQWSEDMPEEQAERYAALKAEEIQVLPTGKRTILRLKTTNGGGLEIVIGDERFVDNGADDTLPMRNAAALARLRKLLRDRKARR